MLSETQRLDSLIRRPFCKDYNNDIRNYNVGLTKVPILRAKHSITDLGTMYISTFVVSRLECLTLEPTEPLM